MRAEKDYGPAAIFQLGFQKPQALIAVMAMRVARLDLRLHIVIFISSLASSKLQSESKPPKRSFHRKGLY